MSFIYHLCHHQILLVSFREILGQGMSPFPGYSRSIWESEIPRHKCYPYEGRQNNVEKDILEKIS